jgi:uncharacterized RDD family membrane protein YckC
LSVLAPGAGEIRAPSGTECASCVADTVFFVGFFILLLVGTPLAIAFRPNRGRRSDGVVTSITEQPIPATPLEALPAFEFGGLWRRLAAGVIDAIVLYGVLLAAAGARIALPPGSQLVVLSDAVWLSVTVGYLPVQWAVAGQTLGMRAVKLRIVRERDGGAIGFGVSLLRFWGWILSVFLFGLGFLWIAFDTRKRGWHDRIAGTIVIHQRRPAIQAVTRPDSAGS